MVTRHQTEDETIPPAYGGVALCLGGGRILLGPPGVLLVAHALRLAERVAARDGIRASRVVAELRAAVAREAEAAGASAAGKAELPPLADLPPSSEGMSTGDAAALLGITDRGVRDLARRGTLDARKSAGGVWLLDRGSVIDYAARRRGRSNVA